MPILVTLDDGPRDRQNIADAYRGKALPTNIGKLTNNIFTCPETGKHFFQQYITQIFLVPVEE
jgi:hypothetical protein